MSINVTRLAPNVFLGYAKAILPSNRPLMTMSVPAKYVAASMSNYGVRKRVEPVFKTASVTLENVFAWNNFAVLIPTAGFRPILIALARSSRKQRDQLRVLYKSRANVLATVVRKLEANALLTASAIAGSVPAKKISVNLPLGQKSAFAKSPIHLFAFLGPLRLISEVKGLHAWTS